MSNANKLVNNINDESKFMEILKSYDDLQTKEYFEKSKSSMD